MNKLFSEFEGIVVFLHEDKLANLADKIDSAGRRCQKFSDVFPVEFMQVPEVIGGKIHQLDDKVYLRTDGLSFTFDQDIFLAQERDLVFDENLSWRITVDDHSAGDENFLSRLKFEF